VVTVSRSSAFLVRLIGSLAVAALSGRPGPQAQMTPTITSTWPSDS
jgi:hypothetical protein